MTAGPTSRGGRGSRGIGLRVFRAFRVKANAPVEVA